MIKFWKKMKIVILLSILLGTSFILYKFIKYLWVVLNSINSDIAVAVIAGSVTLLVSTITVVLSKYFESREKKEERLREKKIPIYEGILEFYFEMLLDKDKWGLTGKKREKYEKELAEKFSTYTRQLISWGSDDIIAAWSDLRKKTINYENLDQANNIQNRQHTALVMDSLAKLVLSIRKDIGHENFNITEKDILSMFINDVENIYDYQSYENEHPIT